MRFAYLQPVQRLREQRPCAILLDLMMPVMDGREMLRRLRGVKRTPVMMLTARDAVADRVVGQTGLEPATPCSQSRDSTN